MKLYLSDQDITVKSGLVDLLDPGDLVIADGGFLIRDILDPRKIDLNIPQFLSGSIAPDGDIPTKHFNVG
jgi:hypothetical protein